MSCVYIPCTEYVHGYIAIIYKVHSYYVHRERQWQVNMRDLTQYTVHV